MSSAIMEFFTVEKNNRIVARATHKLRDELDVLKDAHDEKYKFLVEFIGETLFHIQKNPASFDERCKMNIHALGERFIEEVEGLSLDKSDLEHLFAYCYRFLIEYQLSTPQQVSSELLAVLARVSDFEFEGTVASQIRYAGHQMLVNVVQHYLHHPSLIDLKDLPKTIERSEIERAAAEEAIEAKEVRVQALAQKLESYETAFNFVGLYAGFKSMRAAKVSERRWNFFYLLTIGMLLLSPFVIKAFFLLKGVQGMGADYVGLMTLAGLELLLLYFFRVALQNFKSIKAQLLKIDLRMTLCQFVQSYAEYSKEARVGSPGLLERFEQVVFSGIVNDEAAIPSTFDGLDKLAELVGKMRK